jgi:hypothetical protein
MCKRLDHIPWACKRYRELAQAIDIDKNPNERKSPLRLTSRATSSREKPPQPGSYYINGSTFSCT